MLWDRLLVKKVFDFEYTWLLTGRIFQESESEGKKAHR
jgi:hypothetical protein